MLIEAAKDGTCFVYFLVYEVRFDSPILGFDPISGSESSQHLTGTKTDRSIITVRSR